MLVDARMPLMTTGVDETAPQRMAVLARGLLARASYRLRLARARLVLRWVPAVAGGAVLFGFEAAGLLASPWPVVGLLVIVAAAAGWPSEFDAQPGETGAHGASHGGPGGPRPRRDLESWRAVIEAIPEAAVALDASGAVLHYNSLIKELFPKIRPGQPISQFSRHPELIEAVDRAAGASEPIVVVQLLERVPVERRISATVSRLQRGSGEALPALLVTFRDLTEQDRLEQMRADFVANASHELRTPLASLRGFVETLQGPARDDPQARERFLAIMASQASRMTRLIDDLLSLSRVEMRAHLAPKGIVELNEVAAYVVQSLEPLAQASQITVTVGRLDGPARIRGDREEIVQVLQNLVQNAIKYGREGGKAQARVYREAAKWQGGVRLAVEVTDNGPGIAPEHLPRLTERFYRINVASSREKGGTGLGLAIVKHIVIRHRGDLRISSRVGEGSTFTVLFDELPSGRPGLSD